MYPSEEDSCGTGVVNVGYGSALDPNMWHPHDDEEEEEEEDDIQMEVRDRRLTEITFVSGSSFLDEPFHETTIPGTPIYHHHDDPNRWIPDEGFHE